LWTRISPSDINGHSSFSCNPIEDTAFSLISDENTNINLQTKTHSNALTINQRNPNALHSILSQQRPIAPKNGSPLASKSQQKRAFDKQCLMRFEGALRHRFF
jgi:hypothetical protein